MSGSAALMYGAPMSITPLQTEIMSRTAWRTSVWYRRLFLFAWLLWVVGAVILAAAHQSRMIIIVLFLVALALQPWWHRAVRQAGVFEEQRIRMPYITDPVLRRQHRRAVFWLPPR
jgi:hypothetical protein